MRRTASSRTERMADRQASEMRLREGVIDAWSANPTMEARSRANRAGSRMGSARKEAQVKAGFRSVGLTGDRDLADSSELYDGPPRVSFRLGPFARSLHAG